MANTLTLTNPIPVYCNGGGGGSDGGIPDGMPVFTVTMDDSVSPNQIDSITCNKTFDECAEYLNDADGNDLASVAIVKYVHTSNPDYVYYTTSAFGSRGAMEMIEYTINSGYRYSTEGIRYNYDGTLESFTPVELVTLNATANGTYTTGLTSKFYNEVNVNVPSDITTATVTLINSGDEGTYFLAQTIETYIGEPGLEPGMEFAYGMKEVRTSVGYKVPLYKGAVYPFKGYGSGGDVFSFIDDSVAPVLTGGAEIVNSCIKVTGDCTITLKGNG